MNRYVVRKTYSNGSIHQAAVNAETAEEAELKAHDQSWMIMESGRRLYPGEVLKVTTSVIKIERSKLPHHA